MTLWLITTVSRLYSEDRRPVAEKMSDRDMELMIRHIHADQKAHRIAWSIWLFGVLAAWLISRFV